MDLELKTSCGTTVTLTCELPEQVRFDCFVPGVGICKTTVDPRSDEVDVVDMLGPDGMPYGVHAGTFAESAVLEQAGDVCAVFERALGADHNEHLQDDLKALTTIANVAHHEREAEIAFYLLPGSIRSSIPMLSYRHNRMGERALAAFVTHVLVPRAQNMATAAAKRRQAQWEEEQLEKAAYSRWSAGVDQSIKREKEEGL